MNRFRSIVVGAGVVSVLTVPLFFSAMPAQAKQCSAERPSNARTYWSYRLIDGRKCWYEGKPMLSKSLLQWPTARTAQTNPRRELDGLPASQYNLLDAQASISNDPDAKPKPKAIPEIVDGSPARTSKGTLTPDDLRAWGNSMAAMTADPVLTVLDRWPDAELPQHRSKSAPVEQTSAMNTRAIMMVTIVFMALLAMLVTTFRRVGGARRGGGASLLANDLTWRQLEFTPDQLAKGSPLMMDTRSEMPLQFSSDPIRMSLESRKLAIVGQALERMSHFLLTRMISVTSPGGRTDSVEDNRAILRQVRYYRAASGCPARH